MQVGARGYDKPYTYASVRQGIVTVIGYRRSSYLQSFRAPSEAVGILEMKVQRWTMLTKVPIVSPSVQRHMRKPQTTSQQLFRMELPYKWNLKLERLHEIVSWHLVRLARMTKPEDQP